MKYYLELFEQIGKGKIKVPKIVKLEVKDLTEAKEKLKTEESAFTGLTYIKRFHICHHSENGMNKPCIVKDL